MAYTIKFSKKFERSMRLCQRRGLKMTMLRDVLAILKQNGCLPQQYRPHKLSGYTGDNVWECHIQPNWLLIWRQYDEELVLLMLDTGTHADLF